MSIVIPAYQEAGRLPRFLEAVRSYCEQTFGFEYEILVVDDGSRDQQSKIVEKLQSTWPQLQLKRHPVNRGKGAAVQTGMLAARGEILLFTDADGATPISEEAKLRREIDAGADIALGSRRRSYDEANGVQTNIQRVWNRRIASWLFKRIVRLMTSISVEDTQCGFKMFRREPAHALFSLCREEGYLFDVFVLLLADRLGYRVSEVTVEWTEIPGSKVRFVRDSWSMLTGLADMKRRVDRAARAGRGV